MSVSPVGYMNSLNVIQNYSSSNPEKLIIIDFYSRFCAPCKQLQPRLEELATTYSNIKFYKTDVDDELSDDLVKEFNIVKLPTLIYYKNKQVVGQTIGANVSIITSTILSI
jgi:thiol-disulfide isomerase/thioredoxin